VKVKVRVRGVHVMVRMPEGRMVLEPERERGGMGATVMEKIGKIASMMMTVTMLRRKKKKGKRRKRRKRRKMRIRIRIICSETKTKTVKMPDTRDGRSNSNKHLKAAHP
jgi:hypothetical protein